MYRILTNERAGNQNIWLRRDQPKFYDYAVCFDLKTGAPYSAIRWY